MRTLAEIDTDIAKVKEEMQNVHGTGTEVYARIVGYYRSIRNWNAGKAEEYKQRKMFVADAERIHRHLAAESCACPSTPVYRDTADTAAESSTATIAGIADHYELYMRKTCPNCPPVKECCASLPLSGEQIDVDDAKGFARASAASVFSTPTVIFYNGSGTETGRAYSVKEIRALPCLAHTAEAVPSFF